MTLRLLIATLAACLIPGCAHFESADSYENGLDALVQSVQRELAPKTLPNGKIYCAELARTEREQDECLGDLEDFVYLLVRGDQRALELLTRGAARLKQARKPCRWWQWQCKRDYARAVGDD